MLFVLRRLLTMLLRLKLAIRDYPDPGALCTDLAQSVAYFRRKCFWFSPPLEFAGLSLTWQCPPIFPAIHDCLCSRSICPRLFYIRRYTHSPCLRVWRNKQLLLHHSVPVVRRMSWTRKEREEVRSIQLGRRWSNPCKPFLPLAFLLRLGLMTMDGVLLRPWRYGGIWIYMASRNYEILKRQRKLTKEA